MLMAFLTVWHMKTWRRSSLPGEVTDAVDLLLGTYGNSVYVASMFIYHAEALNGWRLFGVYRIGSAISSILSFHGAFHFNIGTLSKIARKKEEDLGASVSLLRAPHTVILSHRRKKKTRLCCTESEYSSIPPHQMHSTISSQFWQDRWSICPLVYPKPDFEQSYSQSNLNRIAKICLSPKANRSGA